MGDKRRHVADGARIRKMRAAAKGDKVGYPLDERATNVIRFRCANIMVSAIIRYACLLIRRMFATIPHLQQIFFRKYAVFIFPEHRYLLGFHRFEAIGKLGTRRHKRIV